MGADLLRNHTAAPHDRRHRLQHPLCKVTEGSVKRADGAVAVHFVMGSPLTITSVIGLVALTGVVVNDSMILVVFINRRVAEGAVLREAVIEGGRSRLRPILLTSVTTVLGMGPLLLETSFQAKFLIPMGISISAGLTFATILTLVAVPSLYLIVNDTKKFFTGQV